MFNFSLIIAVSIGCLVVLIELNSIIQLSTDLRCFDCNTILVIRIIDGDTFVSGTARVRLYRMDTPEIGEALADEATKRLSELAGDTVRTLTDID